MTLLRDVSTDGKPLFLSTHLLSPVPSPLSPFLPSPSPSTSLLPPTSPLLTLSLFPLLLSLLFHSPSHPLPFFSSSSPPWFIYVLLLVYLLHFSPLHNAPLLLPNSSIPSPTLLSPSPPSLSPLSRSVTLYPVVN